MNNVVVRDYIIPANDFTIAGEASSSVRKILSQIGVAPEVVKRTSAAPYHAGVKAARTANAGQTRDRMDVE